MKTIKIILTASIILFLGISCKEKEEDYYAITYYDVTGVGYVFMYDSAGNALYPVQGAEILATTILEGDGGWFGSPRQTEFYTTDVNGKYQVRFIKRTARENSVRYEYRVTYIPEGSNRGWAEYFNLTVDDVKNVKKTIVLDTFKFDVNKLLR